jgi:hypothetical protein
MGRLDDDDSDSWEEVTIRRRKVKKEDLEDLDDYNPRDQLACDQRISKLSLRLDRKLKSEMSSKKPGSSNFMQRKASETHKRFLGDSFDLDLSYITDRIIAMSFPAQSFSEQKWRNRIDEVKRFFQQRHFHATKIYNLCLEKDRAYDENIFEEYAHWPFVENHVPDIKDIWSFC